MSSGKKIRPGRPRKKEKVVLENQRSSNDEIQFIADDSDCERILQIFAQLANYKIITKVGPKRIKKSDKEKAAEAFEKVRKVLAEFEIEDKQFFLLSDENKKYKIENEQLVDKTEYKLIDQNEFDEKFQLLIQKINIVNRELDKKFIDILKEILIQYSQLVVNREENSQSITEKIIQNIKNPENQDIFQYLLIWQRLRSITKEARIENALENLEEKRNECNNKKSQKVKRKLQDFIDYHERELIEENSMEPIEYLITKLILVFNQIIENN
ncbi:unnamed protein product [Paramecium pentaurelia]|uniref:Uncharacterized protein n=1 Tax=Paramecium pentaurelia TaxID=43138 RepID=A0A8S1YD56_9CILI|nr:unnamed protein product [Paramecium pentaurelia]